MTETKKTEEANDGVKVGFGWVLLGFIVGLAIGLPLDPSCNPPELESQPLGKPAAGFE